jgi:transcription antitermination factor NusG
MNELSGGEASSLFPWYGIRTKRKFEKVAALSLANKGYEQYLPFYRRRLRWSDRVIEKETPLFPGYLFCRFDALKRLAILTTPGVVAVVSVGNQPAPIPDCEIAVVEAVVRSGIAAEPWPYLREGQRVGIVNGPLRGVEGVLLKKKADQWLVVVSVHILQRSVSIEVDRDWIDAID